MGSQRQDRKTANAMFSPKRLLLSFIFSTTKAFLQVAMPVAPNDSEQRRRSSSSQHQHQGQATCLQGGQQQPHQGAYSQQVQETCPEGQQQGVYATSLQGVDGQQGSFPSYHHQQEQYSIGPHLQYRNSYMAPGAGMWVGGGAPHQGPAYVSTLDRQRRGQQQNPSDSMYHTCTRRPQSVKKKVVTIKENNDAESEVWTFCGNSNTFQMFLTKMKCSN